MMDTCNSSLTSNHLLIACERTRKYGKAAPISLKAILNMGAACDGSAEG